MYLLPFNSVPRLLSALHTSLAIAARIVAKILNKVGKQFRAMLPCVALRDGDTAQKGG
jgi:hypothetical protein